MDTSPSQIYTLSLHDALPISRRQHRFRAPVMWIEIDLPIVATGTEGAGKRRDRSAHQRAFRYCTPRSEEHTSELQSLRHLVCRLLLEKKKDQSGLKRHKSHAD